MNRLRSAASILKSAAHGVAGDKVPMMGAALAYYTMFSLAPLLVISIGVAGVFFGETGTESIFDEIRGLVGDSSARAIQSMVEAAARRPRSGMIAAVAGMATLLVGASGVFGQLQESLNAIWKVALKPGAGWGITIRRRLLSFGMVGVIAFILLVSLVVSAAVSAAGKYLGGFITSVLFGAELTRAYSTRGGRVLEPKPHAELKMPRPVSEGAY